MNKKILNTLMVLAGIGCASTAMATVTITGSVTIGGGSFTPSNKVGLSATASATSYAAGSCHVSGTYEYGTVGGSGITGSFSDTSKIYQKTIPAQTGTVGAPTSQSSATALQGSNWQ